MKKRLFVVFILLMTMSLFAVYNVGDIVGDFSWTDSNGENHSIHELTETSKAVVFFWGGTG